MKTPTDFKNNKPFSSCRIGKRNFWENTILLFPIILMLSLTLVIRVSTAASSGTEKPVSPSSAIIAYPLTQFDDGKAKHFQYKTPKGKTIRYFIVKSPDGKVRAAFDACDVCWPSGKGYVQEGDSMTCRNCGRKFPTSQVNVVTGGCNPSALNRQITKTQIILQIKDILEGEKYFNF